MHRIAQSLICIATMCSAHAERYHITKTCHDCVLETPSPDTKTKSTIDDWTRGHFVNLDSGDTVQLCNVVDCATYVRAARGEFVDGNRQQRTTSGPGCTPTSIPRQVSGGIGGGPSGGGTVTVGDLIPNGRLCY